MSPDFYLRLKAQKQDLLRQAFLELLAHEPRLEEYRAGPGGDFNRFLWEYHHKILEDLEAPSLTDLISRPVDKGYYPPEVYSQAIDRRKQVGEKMMGGDYQAPLPSDEGSLIFDLHVLWHIYQNSLFLPVKAVMALDLALAKLLSAAHRRIGVDLTRAQREEPRKARGTSKKKENAAKTDQTIIDTFNGLHFSRKEGEGPSLNKVCVLIRNVLQEKLKDPPSIDKIRRALKRNPDTWGRFEEVTRGKVKKYFLKM